MPRLLVILFLGFVLRVLFIGNPGFVADIAFWKSWSLGAIDHGIVGMTDTTNINYPPGFIYVLWFIGKLYTLLGNPHNYYDFWRENNIKFLIAAKSVPIIADMATACLIYWFFSQKEKLKHLGANFYENINIKINTSKLLILNSKFSIPSLLSSLFYLNPVVILDSALWGQVESFGILFTLVAVILLFYKRPYLASAVFTAGALMKLQNIIYIPIFFIFIYRFFDTKTLIKSIAAAAGTFFIVNLPFVLAHKMDEVLFLLTINSDYFPWLSLNAHNLWWIVSGARGMEVMDKITVLGISNAKTIGLLLFSSIYLLSCLLVYLKPSARNFFLSLTLGIFAFFLFTTQSHERYSYPVVVFLLFLYPFLERISPINSKHEARNPKQIPMTKIQNPKQFETLNNSNFDIRISNFSQKYFWFLYTLLTIAIFFNMHTGLVVNYPRYGLHSLMLAATPPVTIINSLLLIILFFLLLPYVFSQISFLLFAFCFLLFAGSLFLLNSTYIFKGQISLTKFKPISIKQDYGTVQINKSVNSSTGWKKWNRLSNNYFYYRKGFGTHANSSLVFDIGRKFRTFKTDIGIDTEADTPATVKFIIYGEGKQLYESGKMGRFDFPQHVEVNVTGVKYLGLLITDAGDGINSDHADWLNPTLYR